jgi:putative component of toxin-antitoxin plasmid stabilization module
MINQESLQFLREYCSFQNSEEVWILKGISRHKDNNGNMEKFISRLVISKVEDIEDCYLKIKKLGNKLGTNYRMYVSLNSRNVVKGLFNFQKRLLDISYGVSKNLDSDIQMAKKLGSKWKTELEQMNCR